MHFECTRVRSVSGDGAAHVPHRTLRGDVGAPRGGAR
jgi:hypothetical protein